jgi:hypothetical protein
MSLKYTVVNEAEPNIYPYECDSEDQLIRFLLHQLIKLDNGAKYRIFRNEEIV